MPNYTYECECGNVFVAFNSIEERTKEVCKQCGEIASQVIASPRAVHKFKFGLFEHISDEPVYVRGKKEMKEVCERYGVYAPGVLD